MNESGLHPSHEKRRNIISTVFIRRGGAPPGGDGIYGNWGYRGVSTPIILPKMIRFSRETIFQKKNTPLSSTNSLSGVGALMMPQYYPYRNPLLFLCKGNAVLS